MPKTETYLAPWSISAIATAVAAAVACFGGAILLDQLGRWPGIPGSEGPAAALVGSVVLWRFHPKTWGLILAFFAPVVFLLLTLGAIGIGIALGKFEP